MKDILIVEDGKPERERLEKLFSSSGYSVSAFETVGEAEQCLRHEEFRLAVLDIGLADKSGSYLFSSIKRQKRVAFVVIFTGNPSVHLKQRFLEEGAVDYIVKGSPQAQNDAFVARVREIIGEAHMAQRSGIALEEFLAKYVLETSRQLFLDMQNAVPECAACGGRSYLVTFSHQAQVPPVIHGQVICAACGKQMDPEIK